MRVAFVGSYVPRRCGIATFTADTRASVHAADSSTCSAVYAIEEPDAGREYGPEVVGRIAQGDAASYEAAAALINASTADVVNVQHEFGLYGVHREGGYEDHLRVFLARVRRPVLTTLHTVLPLPEPWMRESLRAIAADSTLVVMTGTALRLLRRVYGISGPICRIPHGMPPPGLLGTRRAKEELGLGGRTVISTFGLVNPRKGLEYAIEAMTGVVTQHPDALYLIIGQTHPERIRREGERYREGLQALVVRAGLEQNVRFVNEYVSQRDIVNYLAASDVYVTPYLDPDQITSGTLAYAMGAGKAIVSTPYLHAREALADGRGMLVGFRSASGIAGAVNAILETPGLRASLERDAGAYAAESAWPIVGGRVLEQMRRLAGGGEAVGLRAETPILEDAGALIVHR